MGKDADKNAPHGVTDQDEGGRNPGLLQKGMKFGDLGSGAPRVRTRIAPSQSGPIVDANLIGEGDCGCNQGPGQGKICRTGFHHDRGTAGPRALEMHFVAAHIIEDAGRRIGFITI